MDFSRKCPNCDDLITYKRKGDLVVGEKKKTICNKCRFSNVNNRNKKILSLLQNTNLTQKEIATKLDVTKSIVTKVRKKYLLNRDRKQSKLGRKILSDNFKKNILEKKLNIFGGVKDKKHYEKIFKSRYGLDYSEFKKIQPKFIKYRNKVRGITYKNLKKYSHLFENLDNLGRCGDDGKYQIDHRISIKDGFNLKLPSHLIGHPSNLQIIKWEDNLNKSSNSDITLDEFIFRSSEFLTKNNKIYI